MVKFVITVIFVILARREITFEVATFGGLLFSEGRYFWHLLTQCERLLLLSRVVTLGTLRYITEGSIHMMFYLCYVGYRETVLKDQTSNQYLL